MDIFQDLKVSEYLGQIKCTGEDPDQILQNAITDYGLDCLPLSF